MEALETVINFWEDALAAYQTPTSSEESEFCREIQSLLDIAWQLQDQSELLFLDQRSVLFRDESIHSERQSRLERALSDPNFDSAESFASALDQVSWFFNLIQFELGTYDMRIFVRLKKIYFEFTNIFLQIPNV